MTESHRLAEEHAEITRRYFLRLAAVSTAAAGMTPLSAGEDGAERRLADAIARLEYLTRVDEFKLYGRVKPPPHELSAERRREVGLARETWSLEVVSDPESNARVEAPLSKKRGTALDWAGLMKLSEKHAVRYLHVMSCTNGRTPCGMGLWEGVPLRHVIWMARPTGNVRRVFYYGYHNDDPAQRFQSSLPIGRVLEDPPGEHPVILCTKLNGAWLTPKSGAPVRMFVPNAYGNKSVKWLQRIVLTNTPQSNDTYAGWNNDTVSAVKTCARFIRTPRKATRGARVPVTGVAQVGDAGLRKVQVWLHPRDERWPDDDPQFTRAPWRDVEILPPPTTWGKDLPDGKLPPVPTQIDPATGRPRRWPLPWTIAHWATLVEVPAPGRYDLRCRTIDANGVAQPMPRPFPKSGHNAIQKVEIEVT